MDTFVDLVVMIGAFCFGAAVGMGLRKHKDRVIFGRKKPDNNAPAGLTRDLIRGFFDPLPVESLIVTGREFPIRIQVDLQRALDGLFTSDAGLRHFCAVRKLHAYEGISFSGLVLGGQDPGVIVSPEYDEVDVGEVQPIRCLRSGLWLLQKDAMRYGVFLEPALKLGCQRTGVRIQIITPNNAQGTALAQEFLRRMEQAIQEARSYRGKVLSLEVDHHYTGQASGIMVHRLKKVQRHEVILPAHTVDLLDRNVIRFAAQRHRLVNHGQSAKKGLLLYGPPGTGKTHTIHYLNSSTQ
jgi:cell division protease FtsH